MKKGFVTMATGDERYFIMACNLLKSYKLFTKEEMPFAIISDERNEYTDQFDDVVILPDATKTYMDKIMLLKYCPYDENIFIDADCLAYQDLNKYWSVFKNGDDFSCFGLALPLDSKNGIFRQNDIGKYKELIDYIVHLHGVVYFIRPGNNCLKMLETCFDIIDNYSTLHFDFFAEPADESVFALAMAIHHFSPVKREPDNYVFVPMVKSINCDISKGIARYRMNDEVWVKDCMLIHWANVNTKKRIYKKECLKLNQVLTRGMVQKFELLQKQILWGCKDIYVYIRYKSIVFFGGIKTKIYTKKQARMMKE